MAFNFIEIYVMLKFQDMVFYSVGIHAATLSEDVIILLFYFLTMYVCKRVGQRLALAPRPLMIYCASAFD
jgi:hypothetical protein